MHLHQSLPFQATMQQFMIANGMIDEQVEQPQPGGELFPHDASIRRGRSCTQCLKNAGRGQKLQGAVLQCQHCTNAVCKNHKVIICLECKQKTSFREDGDNNNDHTEWINLSLNIAKTKYFRLWWYDEVWLLSCSLSSLWVLSECSEVILKLSQSCPKVVPKSSQSHPKVIP